MICWTAFLPVSVSGNDLAGTDSGQTDLVVLQQVALL